LAMGTGTGTGKRKMWETAMCAKIALQFDWLLKNNKSAVLAKIILFDWLS